MSMSFFWLTRGEGGLDPPFLGDMICEQPLILGTKTKQKDEATTFQVRFLHPSTSSPPPSPSTTSVGGCALYTLQDFVYSLNIVFTVYCV